MNGAEFQLLDADRGRWRAQQVVKPGDFEEVK
jgi:hypothetical protein